MRCKILLGSVLCVALGLLACSSGGGHSSPPSSSSSSGASSGGWITWTGNANSNGPEWVEDASATPFRFSASTGILNDGATDYPSIKVSGTTVMVNGVSFGTVDLVQAASGKSLVGLVCNAGTFMSIDKASAAVSCSSLTPSSPSSTSGSGGGSGGTGSGSGGAGTGSSSAPWTNQYNSCLQVTASRGTLCGNANSLNVRFNNGCTDTFAYYVCLELTSGGWDCGRGTISGGGSTYYWTCDSTGNYKIFTDADSTKANPTP